MAHLNYLLAHFNFFLARLNYLFFSYEMFFGIFEIFFTHLNYFFVNFYLIQKCRPQVSNEQNGSNEQKKNSLNAHRMLSVELLVV